MSGTVADAGQADKAKVLANAIAGAVKGGQVVNRLSVATPNQVNLRVRIAEVDRTILKQIGIDWSRLGRTVSFNTANNADLTMPTNQLIGWDALECAGYSRRSRHRRLYYYVGGAKPDCDFGPDRELSRRRRIPV